MMKIGQVFSRNCAGASRREVLAVGGLGLLGLTLADVLRSEQVPGDASQPPRRRADKSCISIFLHGGPSHIETFDPKPNAPDNIRGPFGPVATTIPGTQICELLPMMAQRMHHCALIRSLTGFSGEHDSPVALSGSVRSRTSIGAVVTKLQGPIGTMPPYVHLGESLVGSGAAAGGGVFGPNFDPIVINDPSSGEVQLRHMSPVADVSPARFQQRRELLKAIDQVRAQTDNSPALEERDIFYQRAIHVLTSTQVRDAFDMSREPEMVRSKYGASVFGQSLLMARRLVEAGTRFVQVKWVDLSWDIHGRGSSHGDILTMEDELCPRFDQGMSALLDDLHERGLLESTLVVVIGEMGRTPQINSFGGRDHWGACLFALLAGAGIPGGAVVGSSDTRGAYPVSFPVYPQELAATIYRRLGIDTNADSRVHPFTENRQPIPTLV